MKLLTGLKLNFMLLSTQITLVIQNIVRWYFYSLTVPCTMCHVCHNVSLCTHVRTEQMDRPKNDIPLRGIFILKILVYQHTLVGMDRCAEV